MKKIFLGLVVAVGGVLGVCCLFYFLLLISAWM